jgi:septal ring factor EnvC (AmiA/AmiB activator)
LEGVVQALVESHERLKREGGALRADVARKERRIRELEEQLLDSNQRRQEAAKRIDELISQLDHLDARLARNEG